ncbi:unnamed protein product [Dovyalis caffra]|uniref:RING-type E3 ubiquitin transferase n=1 Tax=Dovyalis caffra TaxID=77055 RepID=A0AAV1RS17_9ROSI|nr:unnamed protein product [Dovyalis caffra]
MHTKSHQVFIQSQNSQFKTQTLTLDPTQTLTLHNLKLSLLPNKENSSSFYFTLNGKPLKDSTFLPNPQIAPLSTLILQTRLSGGGGDGGATGAESRDCYLNMYAEKKPDKVDPHEQRLSKWLNCSLSNEPLTQPCVIDRLGNMFNKEALVEALIGKKLPKEFGYIKGLKDMINIQLEVVPGEGSDNARFQCPVSGLEFNGKNKFFSLKNCGHVLSAKALKEVKSSACLVCYKEYEECDKIVINGSEEEVAVLRERMEEERSKVKEKKTKKVKNGEVGANGEEFAGQGVEVSQLSGKKHGIVDVQGVDKIVGKVKGNGGKVENVKGVSNGGSVKRFKAADVVPANATKEAYTYELLHVHHFPGVQTFCEPSFLSLVGFSFAQNLELLMFRGQDGLSWIEFDCDSIDRLKSAKGGDDKDGTSRKRKVLWVNMQRKKCKENSVVPAFIESRTQDLPLTKRMKIQTLLLGLSALLEFFMITGFALPDDDVYLTLSDPSAAFTYNRLSEVEKQCSSFLSSASELKPDEDTKYRLMGQLSFKNGDWEQKTGGMPLMPFSDSDLQTSSISLPTALKLVSFQVKNVSSVQHFQNTVSVGGYLVIGISRESSFAQGFNPSPNFIRPGTSALTLAFEGVYTETEQNGGERHLCLLGKSTLTSGIRIDVPSDVADGFGLQTDQILLVLHYPMTFSLTNREIHGEMQSLNEKASPKYFDTVYISSQLSHQSMYQFSSKVLASTTCEPYLYYHDEWKLFGQQIDISLVWKGNWGCKFELQTYQAHIATCIQATSYDSNGAEASAVLRVIPAEMDPNVARTLTGLSGLVFNAEGRWNPSSGQLCMLSCPTGAHSEFKRCFLWISLYFPRALSIKQRSLVFGSISDKRDEVSSNYRLLFDLVMQPSYLKDPFNSYNTHYLSYNYSKLRLASLFKRKTQYFTTLNHSLLRYPALKGAESVAQLDSLSNELLVDGCIATDQPPDGRDTSISIRMEVLSLGSLIGRFDEDGSKEVSVNTTANVTFINRQLLNVSTHLIFRKFKEATQEFSMISYKNISQMFLEGIYEPAIGEMHLIGCRKVVTGGTGIERGLDCLIKVEIQYPSENMEHTKITITSQRDQEDLLGQDDPLYFGPVSLPARETRYQDHTLTVAYQFEGILPILLVCGVIAMTFLVNGYSLPLVSGAETLFKLHIIILQTNAKSLHKAYYIGLTLIRLVQHLHQYISNPIQDSKFQDSEFVNPDVTSSKSAVVMTMIVVAAIVHIQQNWKKLIQSLELKKLSATSTYRNHEMSINTEFNDAKFVYFSMFRLHVLQLYMYRSYRLQDNYNARELYLIMVSTGILDMPLQVDRGVNYGRACAYDLYASFFVKESKVSLERQHG